VAQPPELAQAGTSGRKLPLSITSVATFAKKTEPIVINKLSDERGVDLLFMSRTYGSSVHIPSKIDDATGTLNFWSTESAAFPPAAVEVLKEAAALLTK